MASSNGLDQEHCVLQRGRSQSDPSNITEARSGDAHRADMDQQRVLHSGCPVSGVRTPPVRHNSKLASIGRMFKPWKWRKKKNEKLKPPSTLEKKPGTQQQSREDHVSRGTEEPDPASGVACGLDDPDSPTQSDAEDIDEEPMVPLATTLEELLSDLETLTVQDLTEKSNASGDRGQCEEGEKDCAPLTVPSNDQPVGKVEAPEGKLQEAPVTAPPQRRASTPPPPNMPVKLLTRLGSLEGPHPIPVKKSPATLPRNFTLPKDPQGSLLRGRISTPTGSPHLALHPQLPPSCIIEELHRALASKHRQDSFQGKEARPSPKRRVDGRLSRTSSTEKEPISESENKKESDENKENRRMDEYYSDQESWNESVISGTLPSGMRKELLAVKLRNRPSKQELEDRNIFPVRSDQERQEIRQQIETKLAK